MQEEQGQPTEVEPELFGDDALTRPPDKERKSKSQWSSNSLATSSSQEMLQQLALDCEAKMEEIRNEAKAMVQLINV